MPHTQPLREEWRKFAFEDDNFESFDIRAYEERIADFWLSHFSNLLSELEGEASECKHFGHTDGEQIDCDRGKLLKIRSLLSTAKERVK